jgi:outer membrane biosynthesis protein TonB
MNFEKPKVLVKMPEPPKPPEVKKPEPPKPKPPEPKKPEPKPKPEPPKPKPPEPKKVEPKPKAQPKVQPKVQPKPPGPPPKPASQAPAQPNPKAPPMAALAPATAKHAETLQAPTQLPPPPAVNVAKALSFLGAKNTIKVAEINPGKYQGGVSNGAKYDSSKVPAVSSSSGTLGKAIKGNELAGPIQTKGAGTMGTKAFGSREPAGGKTLNGVEAKVSISQVYGGGGGGGISGEESMSVSGGTISQEELQKVLAQAMSQLQYCYEKALLSDTKLAGTVTLAWTISTGGMVNGAHVIKSQMNNAKLHQCIAGVVSKLKFPSPKGGAAQVEYPFHFSASRF